MSAAVDYTAEGGRDWPARVEQLAELIDEARSLINVVGDRISDRASDRDATVIGGIATRLLSDAAEIVDDMERHFKAVSK